MLGVGAVFHDKGTVFPVADVSAKLLGLNEGQEERRGEAQAAKQEDVDSLIGSAGGEVAGKSDLREVWRFPRDNP